MTEQTQEFDFHASIKRLAETERLCACNGNVGQCGGACKVCKTGECCGGFGRIVPFAALRVPCRVTARPPLFIDVGYEGLIAYTAEGGREAYQERFHKEHCDCKGLLWVPEQNPAVACWEVRKVLPARHQPIPLGGAEWGWTNPDGRNHSANSCEEATLRAAEAYLKLPPVNPQPFTKEMLENLALSPEEEKP